MLDTDTLSTHTNISPWSVPLRGSYLQQLLEVVSRGLEILPLEKAEREIAAIQKRNLSESQAIEALIHGITSLTSVQEPEWRFVSARLYVLSLYKQVKQKRGFVVHQPVGDLDLGYGSYSEFVGLATEQGLYDPALWEAYSQAELDIASGFIRPEYDLGYDYAGMVLLVQRYLLMHQGEVFELPQEMLLSIALLLAKNEPVDKRLDRAREIYEWTAGRKLSLATPILLNLRRPQGNLSSCFILAMDDSIDSIFHVVESVARISKQGGGVGINISRIRAMGSSIKGVQGVSGGVVPWIRILNDTAVAVNQLGKRAGAVTIALDLWHADIEKFLELQTENGDQRSKAYDIFPQVVVSDLFMRRVESDGVWTLVDPFEVKRKLDIDLPSLWGEAFETAYSVIEASDALQIKRQIPAKDLIKRIMKSQIETGMPYMFFKDTANRLNPNQHDGFIGNGNLCQESFSNFSPSMHEAGDSSSRPQAHGGYVHTCNLASLNLAHLEDDEIDAVTRCAVHVLENSIDITTTPIPESNSHNDIYRTIGIGAMGLADYLAKRELTYGNNPHTLKAVDHLFERIALSAVSESVHLAENKGAYPRYAGSEWSQGRYFGKPLAELTRSPLAEEWKQVDQNRQAYGIRHSQLLAIAPNTSSSLVQGCTASVLPAWSRFYFDNNARGHVPVCLPFLRSASWFYRLNKHIPQREVADVIAVIQKWVDQGISFELVYNLSNNISARDLLETIQHTWRSKVKTIYYVRTIQKGSDMNADTDEFCELCAN